MAIKPFKIAFTPIKYLGESIMGEAELTEPGFTVSGYANTSESGVITSIVIDCKLLPRLGFRPMSAQGATFNSTDKTVTVTFGD